MYLLLLETRPNPSGKRFPRRNYLFDPVLRSKCKTLIFVLLIVPYFLPFNSRFVSLCEVEVFADATPTYGGTAKGKPCQHPFVANDKVWR